MSAYAVWGTSCRLRGLDRNGINVDMWKVDIEDGGDVDVWADADGTQLAQPADWPARGGALGLGGRSHVVIARVGGLIVGRWTA